MDLLSQDQFNFNHPNLYPAEDFMMMDPESADTLIKLYKILRSAVPQDKTINISFYGPSKGDGIAFVLVENSKYIEGGEPGFKKSIIDSYCITAVSSNKTYSRKLSINLGGKLIKIWTHFTGNIAASPEYAEGLDGWVYYFGSNANNFFPVMGRVWTPREGSMLEKLSDLSCLLVEWTKSKNDAVLIEQKADHLIQLIDQSKVGRATKPGEQEQKR